MINETTVWILGALVGIFSFAFVILCFWVKSLHEGKGGDETEPPQDKSNEEKSQKIVTVHEEKVLPAYDEVTDYSDFSEVRKAVDNIWRSNDPIEHATKIHFRFLDILDKIYPYRDNKKCMELILYICDLDISNIDNLVNKLPTPFYMVTPTKKAVYLERQKRFEEAIAVCEIGIEYGLWDSDKSSFERRKERLLKKLHR